MSTMAGDRRRVTSKITVPTTVRAGASDPLPRRVRATAPTAVGSLLHDESMCIFNVHILYNRKVDKSIVCYQ